MLPRLRSKCFGGANLVMVCAHGMDVTNRSVDGIGDATPPTQWHSPCTRVKCDRSHGGSPSRKRGNADGWGFWGHWGREGQVRRTVWVVGRDQREWVACLLCGSTVRSSVVVFFRFTRGVHRTTSTSTEHTVLHFSPEDFPSILRRRAFDAELPGTPGAKPFGWGN
jgi:hypothetical protein